MFGTLEPLCGIAEIWSVGTSAWDRPFISPSECGTMDKDRWPLQPQQSLALVGGRGPAGSFCYHCDPLPLGLVVTAVL